MSVTARAASLLVAFVVVAGLVTFVAIYFVGGASALPTVHYAASGGQVNVVLQEDPQNDSASKPDWVSYYVQDPATQKWVHTTLFSVPANTKVNVTLYGYDGCTPLRNNYYSEVQGTIGNTVTLSQFDQHGKEYLTDKTDLGHQRVVRLQRGAHVRHPRPRRLRAGRLAERPALGEQPVQRVAVHARAATRTPRRRSAS